MTRLSQVLSTLLVATLSGFGIALFTRAVNVPRVSGAKAEILGVLTIDQLIAMDLVDDGENENKKQDKCH